MWLSEKAQAALDVVVNRFQAGDLSPIVKLVKLRPNYMPSARWSLSNQVIAYLQTGERDCRGYRQWQEVGRHVVKGAHAAYILVPLLYTVEEDAEKRQVLRGFKSQAVFPLSMTEGKPIGGGDYEPRQLPPLVDVARGMGIDVAWVPTPEGALGSAKVDGSRIEVGTHDPSVFFHELAHACHARLNGQLERGQHEDQETVAEFTACVLMHLYGFGDRSGNAWRYIGYYADDPLLAIMRAMGDVEKLLSVLHPDFSPTEELA